MKMCLIGADFINLDRKEDARLMNPRYFMRASFDDCNIWSQNNYLKQSEFKIMPIYQTHNYSYLQIQDKTS